MSESPKATNMKPLRITALNHMILKEYIKPGATVVDGTAGNGHDAVFLLNQIEPGGTLYAFDTQPEALKNTRKRIEGLNLHPETQYHLIEDSHGNISNHLSQPVQVAVFNLGYLPGSDHRITTTWSELSKALKVLTSDLMKEGGLISIISYSGHQEGKEEQKKTVSVFK